MTRVVADALCEALTAGGVTRVFGTHSPLPSLPVFHVTDSDLAQLFAAADAALHGVGCSADATGSMRLHAAPGGRAHVHVDVDVPGALASTVRDAIDAVRFGVDVTLSLDVDLRAPCPFVEAGDTGRSGVAAEQPTRDVDVVGTSDDAVARAVAALAEPGALIVAGPGVVRDGGVASLRRLASRAGVGVVNTWGAKGLFEWSDRRHLATAGLQRDDFDLCGVAHGAVVTVGIDRAECVKLPGDVRSLAIADLDAAAAGAAPRDTQIAPPPLRTRLESAVRRWWDAPAAPRPTPAAAVRRYGEIVGPYGLVASEAGQAGLWIARTFPTVTLGQAIVPARRSDGIAVAIATLARLDDPDRRVVAIVDSLTDTADAIRAAAAAIGCPPASVVIWHDGGRHDLDVHAGDVAESIRTGSTLRVGVDHGCRGELEAIAGPVVAWTDEAERADAR